MCTCEMPRRALTKTSHMGQVSLTGGSFEDMATALERVVPGNITGLAPGRMRYTVLLNDDGGIIDDLIVARPLDAADDRVDIVVNADGRETDTDYLRSRIDEATIALHEDRALVALQGPKAVEILPQVLELASPDALVGQKYYSIRGARFRGEELFVARTGYTGEDGFELYPPTPTHTNTTTQKPGNIRTHTCMFNNRQH